MKKIFLAVALFAIAFVQKSFGQDTTKTQSSPLLTTYYNLKDALVSGKVAIASTSAIAYVKALDAIDKRTLSDESRKALLNDANVISQTSDLKVQREKFASLSANMYALAKAIKLSPDPIYQQYCPMKKASWLSNNKAVKNPYYGSAMLTCGSTKETL